MFPFPSMLQRTFVPSLQIFGRNTRYTPQMRWNSNSLNSTWDSSQWEQVKLGAASVSLEMKDANSINGRLKRLVNKKKLSKVDWEVEKVRVTDNFKDLVKSIPNSEYDDETNTWNFSLQYHEEFVKVVKKTGARIGPLPKCVEHIFGTKMYLPKLNSEKGFLVHHLASKLEDVPEELENALFSFQRDGVKFAVAQGGRCLIG